MPLTVEPTALPGVLLIRPHVFEDARGFFLETYHQQKYAELGITETFVQDNHSFSARGTLRGLHYQLCHPQAKICRVASGEVLDVLLDLRRGSPTFGQWTSVLLSAAERTQVYVPAGFAHGFHVLSETADFLYKCSDFYDAGDEGGIAWDDPDLGIDWRLSGTPTLSRKDQANPRLREVSPEALPVFSW